jgi:hypothetical protein
MQYQNTQNHPMDSTGSSTGQQASRRHPRSLAPNVRLQRLHRVLDLGLHISDKGTSLQPDSSLRKKSGLQLLVPKSVRTFA